MKCIISGTIFCILAMAGCEAFSAKVSAPEQITALVWNVQSLFDGQEAGNEYAEFREAAGWTEEKYRARITAISQAIGQIAANAPDFIGLIEIENSGVLKDIAGSALSKHGYNWTAFTKLPGQALGIGFLSRFPLKDIKAHSISAGKETAPRPVLELMVEPRGKPIVFLLCHWKSKLGGETETIRRSSAKVVQRRLFELHQAGAETPVIVMGDLNENHDEFYLCGASILSALLPDDPEAAAIAANAPGEYLVLSGEKPPRAVYFPEEVSAFYSPWKEEINEGSYYYKGGWETIDHFLLSDALFSGTGWDYAGFKVLNEEPFVSSKGIPYTYTAKNGRGLSDHLPLLLKLQFEGE